MILHDSVFENLAKASIKSSARVIVTENISVNPLVFTGVGTLMSVTIDNVGMFLGTATKKATIKLLGIHLEFISKSFEIKVGLQNPTDKTWIYISEGSFATWEVAVDYEKNSTTVTLYDAMWTAVNSDYNNFALTYPMTVQSLAGAIAAKLGIILATGFDALPNYDYLIAVDPYVNIDGTKLRDVIEEIAQTTATTAIISGAYLKFVPFALPTETIADGTLKALKLSDQYGVINSVILSRQPQNDDIFLSDAVSIAANGLTESKIVNNQIMDDTRTTLISGIYNALNGTSFYGSNMKTIGYGWYEIGDTIAISQGSSTYNIVVTEIHLTIDGSITENIVCTVPSTTKTNYLSAGGILKTIYNTELKTDKQNQQIVAVVSEVATLGDEVSSNYSQVVQNINNITNTFQTTGGNNLIKNSVGYATETDGTLTLWTKTGTGVVTSNTSPESFVYGAISGNQINLSGVSPKISQRVLVKIGGKYSFSFRVKKTATGSASMTLSNTTDSFVVAISAGTEYLWDEVKMVSIVPTLGYLDLDILCSGAEVFFTDIMLVTGDSTVPWQQANGEILNTQVALNSEGIKVNSSVYQGDFTQITPLEFAGYSSVSGSSQRTFYLNRDITHTKKFEAEDQISMPPIKIVPITTGTVTGWAFVGTQ